MADKATKIGIRLAIRTEGEWLRAYLAYKDHMEGAKLLGSILKGACERDDSVWQAWKAVMTSVMSNAVEDVFGERPDVTEQKAPEHERSGTA